MKKRRVVLKGNLVVMRYIIIEVFYLSYYDVLILSYRILLNVWEIFMKIRVIYYFIYILERLVCYLILNNILIRNLYLFL